jgi:aminopeptidase N
MGTDGEMTAFTQWYPKPAVYDNKGWHYFPYLDIGEFYSEFGSFDVEISVPQDYIVAATGDLLTKQEYNIYKKMAAAAAENKYIKYPTTKNKTYKTLHFTQDKVHDFAWFISKKFVPRTDTLHLKNGHIVEIWTFNLIDADKFWKDKFLAIAKRSVKYLSEWNFPYPYSTCKVVFGGTTGGGMEYPTITIIDKPYVPSDSSFMPSIKPYDEVIFHEIGHNWFYGILGFNERRYPFLDEGFNSYYDHRYGRIHSSLTFMKDFPTYNTFRRIYEPMVFLGLNQPLYLTSTDYTRSTYYFTVYEKMAAAVRYLENYLGTENFDKIMQALYRKWQFKHPYPEDIEQVFDSLAQKPVDWFFGDLVKTTKFIKQ